GLAYVAYVYTRGGWRDLVPRKGDARDAWEMIKFYLTIRKDHPHQGKHNALQKATYFSMPIIAAIIVLSGIAIWKPVQLHWLTTMFGGFAVARFVHFSAMVVLFLLVFGHVFMVLSVDPYALRSMLTGWYNTNRSPEARNARPFYHLFAKGEPPSDSAPP